MKWRLVISGFTLLVILTVVPTGVYANSSDDNQFKIPADVLAKIGSDLSERIGNITDNEQLDVHIACDFPNMRDYAERAMQFLPSMKLIKNWNELGVFRANLTRNQICSLSELPYITRIDLNSMGSICLSDSRFYTKVDWFRGEYPSVDGNTDGSASYSKNDVVIALLDTGVNKYHLDLDEGKVLVELSWLGPDPADDNGHGTHMASIIAGTGDGNGQYKGVAPGAALVSLKMAGSNGVYSESDALDAMSWVAQYKNMYGIEIVSCSWGGTPYGELDAIALAADTLVTVHGLVVVTSAGNNGPSSDTITSPGTGRYVITVGNAINPAHGGWSLKSTSSRGPCDDGRIKPDILAPGESTYCADYETTSGYDYAGGTSAAAAFVSGLVALWLDYDPSLKGWTSTYHRNPIVKKLLMASAKDMPGDSVAGKDNNYGAGRVDAWDELWFINRDVSRSSSTAPTTLSYSYNTHSYNRYNEPLWIYDKDYGADWYKLYCYSGLFMAITVQCDPDLVARIYLYNYNLQEIKRSSESSSPWLEHTTTYSGLYYVKILVRQYSGDYYDITILTGPS